MVIWCITRAARRDTYIELVALAQPEGEETPSNPVEVFKGQLEPPIVSLVASRWRRNWSKLPPEDGRQFRVSKENGVPKCVFWFKILGYYI